MSVGPIVLKRLPFSDWRVLYTKHKKSRVHEVVWTHEWIGNKKVLVVNAKPNNYAFGSFSYIECKQIGTAIMHKIIELTKQ